MPGVPVLKPREVIAILNALGFVEVLDDARLGGSSLELPSTIDLNAFIAHNEIIDCT